MAPDDSTLTRYRTTMTEVKTCEPLFKEISRQFVAREIIVKTENIIDAHVINIPLKSKVRTYHKVGEDRERRARS